MLQKIFLFFLCIGCFQLSAQNCDILLKGNVLDEHDKSALDYSTIYIEELKIGVTADALGNYEFKNLCAGKYTFIISHLGCTPDTVFLNISKSGVKNFYLEHHAEELAEIISTATTTEINNAQTINILDKKSLEKLEGKDLGSILSSISGVTQLKTGANISKPIIHGLYGDRIAIVNNGVKLETQNWGTEHAPEIDPFTSATIKVIKGAGSLAYGTDATSGMIILEPPTLKKHKNINASLSLVAQTNGRGVTTSARIEQGFKKQVAYFLQGTFKRIGDLKTPRYLLSNTGVQEGNFSAGFGVLKKGWDITANYSLFNQEIGILRSAHIGNLTDLQNAIASETPLIINPFTHTILNPKQKIAHHLAKVHIVKYFKNENKLDLTYSFQFNNRKEFDIRRGGRSEIPALDMRLFANTILASYLRNKSFNKATHEGKSGFNFVTKHNANNAETGVRPLIPDYYQYSIGVYNMEKFTIKDLIIEFGARYDYTRFNAFKFDRNNVLQKPSYNFHTYAFSAGASWKNKTEVVQLQSNISYSSRFPNANELFSEGLHHGIASLEFGNENLKPERGVKWINTINTNYKKFIQAEVSFYISKMNDFIYLAPLPEPVLTIRGAFPAFQYYQTNARLLGLDATLKSEPTAFLSLLFRSSIIRGKNTSANDFLIFMPADRIFTGFDVHHDFKKIKYVHFGMQVQHVLKQKRTPVLITDFKEAPNAYTILNAEAGFEYTVHEKHKVIFSITGENITNTTYRDYLNRFRYFADEIGWNLTFRLKYNFS